MLYTKIRGGPIGFLPRTKIELRENFRQKGDKTES